MGKNPKMAVESKHSRKKAIFVPQMQQNNCYLNQSKFDPLPVIDTINELMYKCVRTVFKIVSSIFFEIG